MTIFLIYMCQLLTLMAFHTTLCEGKCVWHKREEVNKKTNKVVSLPLPPQQTPVHLLLCMSLYPWQVHMSLTPTPQPEQNSQAAGPSQPPTQPTAITPIFLPSLESSEVGVPQNKGPSLMGLSPYCPWHTEVYLGLWKEPYSAHSLRLYLMSLLKACTKTVKYKH